MGFDRIGGVVRGGMEWLLEIAAILVGLVALRVALLGVLVGVFVVFAVAIVGLGAVLTPLGASPQTVGAIAGAVAIGAFWAVGLKVLYGD